MSPFWLSEARVPGLYLEVTLLRLVVLWTFKDTLCRWNCRQPCGFIISENRPFIHQPGSTTYRHIMHELILIVSAKAAIVYPVDQVNKVLHYWLCVCQIVATSTNENARPYSLKVWQKNIAFPATRNSSSWNILRVKPGAHVMNIVWSQQGHTLLTLYAHTWQFRVIS